MSVTLLTAYEMVHNRTDLMFIAGEHKTEQGKFAFCITRGPGHRYKPLLSSKFEFESQESAADAVQEILTAVVEAVEERLGKNRDGALTAEDCQVIMEALRRTGSVETRNLFETVPS
jgi:hypothetical protein